MRPIFYYDQSCPFCCRCVEAWKKTTRGLVYFQPLQKSIYPLDQVVFVEGNNVEYQGARAVVEMFACNPKKRLWRWMYLHIPFFDRLFEWMYKQISSCRECGETFGWIFYGRTKDKD